MIVLIAIRALCGVICSGMTLAYAASNDRRSRRLASVWFKRMLVFAVVGIVLVYIEVQ